MQAGDALYIPEGWWHQIDSVAGTIAINIWWRSAFDRQLGSHMDAYYLRRALQSLTETHKAQLLKKPFSGARVAQEADEPPSAQGGKRPPAAQGDNGSEAAGVLKGGKGLMRPVKRQRTMQDKKPTDVGGPEAISLLRQQNFPCMCDWPRLQQVSAAIYGLLQMNAHSPTSLSSAQSQPGLARRAHPMPRKMKCGVRRF